VIRVIHTDSLGAAKARNKFELNRMKRYASFLKTEDGEDVEEHLLYLRKLNKRPKEHTEWSNVDNKYLAEITSVDARIHNLALQHCGYARKSCALEQKIKGLNSMKDLREEAKNDEDIAESCG